MSTQDIVARLDAVAGPYALHVLAFFGAFTIVVGLLKLSTAFLSIFVLGGTNVDRPQDSPSRQWEAKTVHCI